MKAKYINSLINGFQKFLEKNTGITNDAKKDHYVLNPEGVLSNNRHFISDSAMQGQPNGDATTEGQSLLILGWLHCYIGSNRKRKDWLQNAINAFDAYVKYFYRSEIPETPRRWQCNWIINGKEPVLSDYPVDDLAVTHSGFKGIKLEFTEGKTVIPAGEPYFGEYLDKATFAFDGNLTYQSIIASVQKENADGSTNWSEDGVKYDLEYIVDYDSRKIDSSGNILEENCSESKGTVQLKDHTISGVHKLNFSPKVPVENGGQLIGRNEPWHNRPLNVPIHEPQLYGNSSDSEQWFCEASRLLLKETGDKKYYNAWKASEFTCIEYAQLEQQDRFFRKEILSKTEILEGTPFTDGISYDYQWSPNGTMKVKYSRDLDGYINYTTDLPGQNVLEQKSINPKVSGDQKIHVEYAGKPIELTESSDSSESNLQKYLNWNIELTIADSIQDLSKAQTYNYELDTSDSDEIKTTEVQLSSFKYLTNTIALKDVNEYDGLTKSYEEVTGISGKTERVLKLEFANSDSGCNITIEKAPLSFITYKAVNDYDLYFYDDDGYRFYFVLNETNNFVKYIFDLSKAKASYYQPNHPDVDHDAIPAPKIASGISEVIIGIDDSWKEGSVLYISALNKDSVYFNGTGYISKFSLSAKNSDLTFTAKVGDCYIVDPLPSGNLGIPGVIPYSNITSYGTHIYSGWRGCPYPGYQYPLIYVESDYENSDLYLNNMIEFMYQGQLAYKEKFNVLGPSMQAYVWNRWDCLDYGDPNTFTMKQFNGTSWSGYEPRCYQAAACAWLALKRLNKTIPEKLIEYTENWSKWLISYYKEYNQTPTDFPSDSVPKPIENDFTGHMTGLWLAGACESYLAGSQIDGLLEFINNCVKELIDNYINTKIPGHVMNGCWSPSPRISTGSGPENEGMFFGFWAGEILRGLGLYLQVQNNII